jgi:hypothetical protein
VSPPKRQPKFFIDRSFGRIAVPAGLREDGWDVVTLSEHYGMPRDEDLASADMVFRFIVNKQAIFHATATSGPFIYSVQQDRLDQLYPKKLRCRAMRASPASVVPGIPGHLGGSGLSPLSDLFGALDLVEVLSPFLLLWPELQPETAVIGGVFLLFAGTGLALSARAGCR